MDSSLPADGLCTFIIICTGGEINAGNKGGPAREDFVLAKIPETEYSYKRQCNISVREFFLCRHNKPQPAV